MSFLEKEAVDGTIKHGKVTGIGTTAVALSASRLTLLKGVTIKADPLNGATIYIGGSDVTSANGYPLAGGEELYVPERDLSRLYAVAASGTQALTYLGK